MNERTDVNFTFERKGECIKQNEDVKFVALSECGGAKVLLAQKIY